MMRRSGVAAAGVLVILGCVVIPDKFEADIRIEIRHVEEQADNVLDYIEGETDTLPEPSSDSSSMMQQFLYALAPIQVAYAQDDLTSNSAAIKPLAEKMRNRLPEVNKLKASGSAGEDKRGYLALRDSDAMKDAAAKNAAQQIIAAENEDRKALYQLVAEENRERIPGMSLAKVEGIYAKKRLERAKTGEIFELPTGAAFEEFQKTDLCKKLGDQCKAGAWVTIP